MQTLTRWFVEDRGDDLLEYAILAAFVGVAGAVALALMPAIINDVYTSWDTSTQEAWEPQNP